jgi:hypothetical protein
MTDISNTGFVGLGYKYCPPKEGARGCPVTFDFSVQADQIYDMTSLQNNGKFSQVEGVFVSNVGNANPLDILVDGSGQVITIPAGKCAYMPLLAPNPPKFTFSTTPAGGLSIQAIFLNYAIIPLVW